MHLKDYIDRYEFSSYLTIIPKLSLYKEAEYKFSVLDKWSNERFEIYLFTDLSRISFKYQNIGIAYQLKHHIAIVMGKSIIADHLRLALNNIEYL